MQRCSHLDGEQLKPKTASQARKLIGKSVVYLRSCDIDRSGRGYLFPKQGKIMDVHGRNLMLDGGDRLAFSSIVDMVENPSTKNIIEAPKG